MIIPRNARLLQGENPEDFRQKLARFQGVGGVCLPASVSPLLGRSPPWGQQTPLKVELAVPTSGGLPSASVDVEIPPDLDLAGQSVLAAVAIFFPLSFHVVTGVLAVLTAPSFRS